MDQSRKCFICKASFTNDDDLWAHFTNPVTCDKCNTYFHTREEFEKHNCKSVYVLKCFVCKATFANENEFRAHFFDSTICSTCNKHFHTRKEYEDHICPGKEIYPLENLVDRYAFLNKRPAQAAKGRNEEDPFSSDDEWMQDIPDISNPPPEKRKKTEEDPFDSDDEWVKDIPQSQLDNHDLSAFDGVADFGHDISGLSNELNEISDHESLPDPQPDASPQRNQVGRGHRAAMNGAAEIETFQPTHEFDLLMELKEKEAAFKEHLKSKLVVGQNLKWYMVVCALFSRETPDENGEIKKQTEESCISTETYTAQSAFQIDEQLPLAYYHLNKNCEEVEKQGTGWNLEKIIRIELHTAIYNPLAASSYIPLPDIVKKKKAVLNIQNEDDCCFVWCILAHLHPVDRRDHPYRVTKYQQYWNELDITDLKFPTPPEQVPKFEKKNNLRINVFTWEDKQLAPIYVSRVRDIEPINLLLISEDNKNHYCLIRDFSRLANYRTKHDGKEFFCYNCIHACSSKERLEKHLEYCLEHRAQRLTFPTDPYIKFKSVDKTMMAPFVIYCDCESCTVKQEGPKYQHHEVNSFAMQTVSPYEETKIVLYRGEDAGTKLLEGLLAERDRIVDILSNPADMIFTDEDKKAFDEATKCYICKQDFDPYCKIKVRDHDHITGKYRGAAHNPCNLNLRFRKTQQDEEDSFIIPVIFHNLRGYDGHIIMQTLGKNDEEELRVIANTLEKYISFSVGQLRFLDSFQFMNTSLEKLVNNLAAEGKEKFRNMAAEFPDSAQQELLLRKGVYPYDYMDDPEKFKDTQLPSKEDFYSELREEGISDDDYAHAQNVWNVFKCKTFGDYHDIYLKTDVLALADVFENFRKVCMQTYGLDPAHYYTAPGLSWDAMLRYTGVHLELITNKDKYLMMEKGIRGGISVISQKYAKANNPYVEGYDPSQPTNYQMYYDANNLYGWAMSQPLPEKLFDWVPEPEKIDLLKVAADSEKGYIAEVDLEYPPEIHEEHNDYPMAPEPLTIPIRDLSEHTQQLRKDLQIKSKPTEKLIPNLKDKKNYVLHYRNLQQYVEHGLKVTKVHRILQFDQRPWLKDYIALNTEKRKQAKNPFEKDFFKLMNNAIFGKTMENVRKRIDVELVHRDRRFQKVVAKPTFHRFRIFNEDLVGVHLLKCKLMCDKPIQTGLAILDLSKTLMYSFHYDYMKQKYPDCRLLFTDTDSLCYDILTEDIYKDMKEDEDLFDTSDYPKEHFLHSEVNKKVLGKMKDECAGIPIQEFVGLRPKMYSILYGDKEKKAAKGVTRPCQRKIKHENYRNCLFQRTQTIVEGRIITSVCHEIYTEKKKKIGLSPYDDKRYVLDDGYTTLAHGHHSI